MLFMNIIEVFAYPSVREGGGESQETRSVRSHAASCSSRRQFRAWLTLDEKKIERELRAATQSR